MKILINHNSFVDVITNSSTELFVCNTDKTIEMVESILRDILDTYNDEIDKGYYGHELKETYDEVFKKPYIYTKEAYEEGAERYKRRLKEAKGYTPHQWGYEGERNIGAIMIQSATDNSIPYSLWEKINEVFNGSNYHLG